MVSLSEHPPDHPAPETKATWSILEPTTSCLKEIVSEASRLVKEQASRLVHAIRDGLIERFLGRQPHGASDDAVGARFLASKRGAGSRARPCGASFASGSRVRAPAIRGPHGHQGLTPKPAAKRRRWTQIRCGILSQILTKGPGLYLVSLTFFITEG